MWIKYALGTFLLGTTIICSTFGVNTEDNHDTVVIEASNIPSLSSPREKRHFSLNRQISWADALGEGSPCLTSTGVIGSCTSFQTCYPYVKVPQISIWESWVLGNYDTCSYFTTEGRQAFGVCCTNPITPVPPENPAGTDDQGVNQLEPARPDKPEQSEPGRPDKPEQFEGGYTKDSKYQHWPPSVPTHPTVATTSTTLKPPSSHFQWPPPIPTHPADHHYPTHPPASIPTFPPISTTPSIPTTTTKPSTHYPWLPTAPTHPPRPDTTTAWPFGSSTTTTTTTGSPLDDGGLPLACGAKNGFLDQERIVGGQNASPNEWPWVAVLFNNGRQFCGGSLIDNIHILTAAHCVAHMSSWDVARLKVHLGDHNIRSNTEVKHIERKVQRVVRHRGFDFRTLYHDVAILTMDKRVEFTKAVRPICLPNSAAKAYSGSLATVVGWGSLRENGPQPAILQKVAIPIWANRDCARKYGAAAPAGIIDSMVCAGQAAKDSCSGDSGGPMMVNEGRWVQVGIVSWGIGCGKGQYPGVYTRVTSYLPWIKKNLSL